MGKLVKLLSGKWARDVLDCATSCIVLIFLSSGCRLTPITVTGLITFALILINICLNIRANGWKRHPAETNKFWPIYGCLWFAALLGIYFGSVEVREIIAYILTVVLILGLVVAAILPRGNFRQS